MPDESEWDGCGVPRGKRDGASGSFGPLAGDGFREHRGGDADPDGFGGLGKGSAQEAAFPAFRKHHGKALKEVFDVALALKEGEGESGSGAGILQLRDEALGDEQGVFDAAGGFRTKAFRNLTAS